MAILTQFRRREETLFLLVVDDVSFAKLVFRKVLLKSLGGFVGIEGVKEADLECYVWLESEQASFVIIKRHLYGSTVTKSMFARWLNNKLFSTRFSFPSSILIEERQQRQQAPLLNYGATMESNNQTGLFVPEVASLVVSSLLFSSRLVLHRASRQNCLTFVLSMGSA